MKLLVAISVAFALKSVLNPAEEFCFRYRTPPTTEISILYEALPNDDSQVGLTINRQLLGQNDNEENGRIIPVISHPGLQQNEVTVSSDDTFSTLFFACFENVTRDAIEVSFYIQDQSIKHDVAGVHHTEALQNTVTELTTAINKLVRHQKLTSTRERVHAAVLVQGHNSVLTWHTFQCFVMILIAVAQVYYIERLFNSGKSILQK